MSIGGFLRLGTSNIDVVNELVVEMPVVGGIGGVRFRCDKLVNCFEEMNRLN